MNIQSVPAARPTVSPTASAPASVLPPPDQAQIPSDSLTMLLTLLSKQSQADAQQGMQNVDSAQTERKQRLLEAQQAYQKMKDAQSDPFGWLGGLFKAIVAVAGAAATVMTGGTAAPILAASASAFGAVVQQTQCFGEISNVVGSAADLAGSIGTGNLLFVAGDGSNLTGAVGTETKSMDADTAMAFQIGGGVAKGLGGLAPSPGTPDPVVKAVITDARIVGIAGAAAYDIDRAVRDGDAAQDAIDMKKAQMAMARIGEMIDDLISGIQDNHKSHDRAVKTVDGAIETQGQTEVAAAQGIRG